MPTFEREAPFNRDFATLSRRQRRAFLASIPKFVADLRRGNFPKGLRVKSVEGSDGEFEMTWAPDGRAIFRYGESVRPGEPHIIWLRVGTHDIFKSR